MPDVPPLCVGSMALIQSTKIHLESTMEAYPLEKEMEPEPMILEFEFHLDIQEDSSNNVCRKWRIHKLNKTNHTGNGQVFLRNLQYHSQ